MKLDIKKFFDSVDHTVLIKIWQKTIFDPETMYLLKEIIGSFKRSVIKQTSLFDDSDLREANREREREREECPAGTGIPIGNLTSQLFANIYLNELDQFIKHKLRIKYYLRYCDDFVILSNDRSYLEKLIPIITNFLDFKLKLKLHKNKIIIRKLSQGIDFLGYVVLPHCVVLRTKTKKRMMKKINDINLASYFGLLKHCEGHELRRELLKRLSNPQK